MTDNRRSLSPLTRAYSALQTILSPDQFDRILPLVNSAVTQNTMGDEDFAREQQRRLYTVQSMEVDEPFPSFVPSFHPQRNSEIDADAAFARRLQEEEYSRRSIVPPQPFRPPAHMNKRTPTTHYTPNDSPTASDAVIAAHLQAEEERRARRHEQRPRSNPPQHPTPPPRPPPPLPLDPRPDTPENIPMTRLTLRRPTASHRASNNDANNSHLANLLQMVRQGPSAAQANRSGFRRARDAHNHQGNFGPNDYESLLELDNNVRNNPLTEEQINRLPTERFLGARNANDEENKCSVCWDDFEKNQVLRRLLCFHLFHKDCIDKWLKDKNQCPICRAPPIQ